MARAAAENPNTPRSLAWALANDEEAAAVLVLEACAALADADLLSIVQSSENFGKMNAIARRSSVSAAVSRSLVHHGDEGTAQTLPDNAKAQIPEDAFWIGPRPLRPERRDPGSYRRPRALAAMTRSPTEATRRQLLASPSALHVVWSQASLPADWLSVASAALSALVQIDRAAGKSDRELFARNVVDRTLANLKADKVALSAGQLRVLSPPRAR